MTNVNNLKISQFQIQQDQIRLYRGEKVTRTDLKCKGYAKRIILIALAIISTLGLALLAPPVKKLWDELKEGKKITVIPSQVLANLEKQNSFQQTQEMGKKQFVNEQSNEPVLCPSMLKLDLNQLNEIKPHFEKIKSNQTVELKGLKTREDFMYAVKNGQLSREPVVMAKSHFVPKKFPEHLMRNKQDKKLGIKMQSGDQITNMEGALHTFLTAVTPIIMSGDHTFKNGHTLVSLNGKGRNVVLSTAIHPDFENGGRDEVVMQIVGLKNDPVAGKPLDDSFLPYQGKELPKHEEDLKRHMVYHLTANHRLPSLGEIKDESIHTPKHAMEMIEALIKNDQQINGSELQNQYVQLNQHVISLEALFNVYVHQIRNEFILLEELLPQGYVYTINPPAIFAKQIGGENVPVLNRLQLLALKMHHQHSPLENLKVIGFANFADKAAVDLYKVAFQEKAVHAKDELFSNKGLYSMSEDYALVIHNNSDAFGQNIETEGSTSLDGVIGSFSSAANNLSRDRKDLLDYVVNII